MKMEDTKCSGTLTYKIQSVELPRRKYTAFRTQFEFKNTYSWVNVRKIANRRVKF